MKLVQSIVQSVNEEETIGHRHMQVGVKLFNKCNGGVGLRFGPHCCSCRPGFNVSSDCFNVFSDGFNVFSDGLTIDYVVTLSTI